MKKIIHIVLLAALTIMLGIVLGLGVDGAGAADPKTGSASAIQDGRAMSWDAMIATSNSASAVNKNGLGEHIFIAFSNDGAAAVDDTTISMWLQHSVDGNAPWTNVLTGAIDFNSGNTETFIWTGDVRMLPYVRWHTTDVDISVANAVTPTLWIWK